jgi:uncharacterized protein (UPF0332 family)
VAILNPEHLFEQADRLIVSLAAGPPRQVDLRRAISAAYYGLFHAIVTAVADQFVGVTKRSTAQYQLVYRSVDHRSLRTLCEELKKNTLPARFSSYAPPKGFGNNILAFCIATVELQEKRHAADYDPLIRVRLSDAVVAISTARAALARYRKASPQRRRAFLTLLSFPPRSK